MKNLLLFICLPLLSIAQENSPAAAFKPRHTVFVGLQIPLNYTAGYQLQFSRRLSAQLQGGLIAAPFDHYILKSLSTFGLDPELGRALDKTFRQGSLVGLGVNVHANSPWYAGVYGQYVRLAAGPITPADALGLYFKQDFSGFGLLSSPAFAFNLQSSWWVGGLRLGRSIAFGESRWGLKLEGSMGKILTSRNRFSSNRPLVEALGVTQRLYSTLNNEVDSKLRRYGYLPTLNVLLTYRLAGEPR